MIEKKLGEKKKLVVKKLKNIKQEFGTGKHFFKRRYFETLKHFLNVIEKGK